MNKEQLKKEGYKTVDEIVSWFNNKKNLPFNSWEMEVSKNKKRK